MIRYPHPSSLLQRGRVASLAAGLILASVESISAQTPASPTIGAPAATATAPKSVAEIQKQHDRTLIRDLTDYIARHPKADDLDQAYMKVFDKAIEHDWFAEHEAIARQYLASYPEGAVRSLARIVGTMARAQAGQYGEALASYKALLDGLNGPEQAEFASTFADSLAEVAIAAGEVATARSVYEALLAKFGADDPSLKEKIQGEVARIARVGLPAPNVTVTDLAGAPLRLADLRGKYVLVDFWATTIAPSTAELPRLQSLYTRFKPKGLEIVAVSLDESRGVVEDFVRARGLNWKQVHNATCNGDLVEAFGVRNIPASFLIDPTGRVVRLDLRGQALDRALETLLR